MKKLFIILLISGSLTATAQESFQKELFSADAVLKYRAELELTPKQIDNIKKISADIISTFNSKKWDLDAELVALNKYLSQPQVDEKGALAQMEKIIALEDELKRLKLSMLIKIKNELKPAQQDELKILRTEKDISENTLTTISENPRIVLRGSGPNSGATPLYIIKDKKGERRETSAEGINPEDIDSITILKNESATLKYGPDARNGVIVIVLKHNK